MRIASKRLCYGLVLCAVGCSLSLLGSACQRSPEARSEEEHTGVPAGEIRQSVIAGSWYPDHPDSLKALVDGYLRQAYGGGIEGRVVALIAPHAGYRFSGLVAGHAYKALQSEAVRTVVILGPSHHHSFRGFSVYRGRGYETPLGIVPVNTELAESLAAQSDLVSFIPGAHQAEHCIEIQLPFLQEVLTSFDLVPIVVGPSCTFDDCLHLADLLTRLLGGREDVLLVASSDMSHYPAYDAAEHVDREMLSAVESFDIEHIVQTDARLMEARIPNLGCTFCGLKAVLVTLMAAGSLGAERVKVLKYANSGDVPFGNKNRVVGYGAVAVYENDRRSERIDFEPLDEEAQQMVLSMAREAIETFVRTGRAPEYRPEHPVLNERRGVFVTITKHGRLRGCIGYHGNDVPLYQLVPDRAVAAATRDSRFPPISVEELDDVKIKVSVYLTNVYRITDLAEFELGKHGIILRKGERGATYLPEVPVEAGWTKEEEMDHLCRKAGLPQGAWRENAELSVYSTQAFGEK